MQPPRPRSRRLAWWLLVSLLLLGAGLYLGRDLPRRMAEKQLAAALGGPVTITEIAWPRGGVFVLRGLTAEAPVLLSPAVRRAAIERIEARAGWRQLFGGEVDHLALFGLDAELDPARPLLPESAGAGGMPFATLEVAPGARLRMVGAAGEELAAAELRAELREETQSALGLSGSFAATARGLDLADVEAFLPLELPEAARRQLAGLALGEVGLSGSATPAGLDLTATNKAWQEAVFALRGEHLEARLRGLELAALSSPGAPISASGRADLAASGTLDAGRLTLALGPASFAFAAEGATPQRIGLSGLRVDAGFASRESGYLLEVASLEAELLEAAELLPPEARRLLPLALAWQGEADLGGRAASGKGELRSRPLGRFPFAGKLSLSEGVDLEVATPELPMARILELLPERPAQVGTAGSLSARVALRGQPDTATAHASVKFRDLAPAPQVSGLNGDAKVRWSAAVPLAVVADSVAAKGLVHLPIEGLAPQPFETRFRGTADLEARRFELRQLTLATERLGRVEGEVALRLPPDGGLAGASAAGALQLSEVVVPIWLGVVGAAAMPEAMSFKGSFSASPRLEKKAGGPWQLAGTYQLADAGFASAAGDRVLEGLALAGDFAAEAAPDLGDGSAYTLRAGGSSGGFQLLWGTLFGDFSAAKVELEARAAGRIGAAPRLEANVRPGGGVTVEAALEGAKYRLKLESEDLEAVRAAWLAPLFAEAAQLRLAGRLELGAAGELPPEPGAPFSARGRLELRGGELHSGTMAAEGVELELPFDLRGAAGSYAGPRLTGRLSARRLAAGNFTLPPLSSRLFVEADSVGLEEALAAPFAGGTVRLEKVAAGEILAASPRLEAAIGFDGISLAEIFATAGMLPLEGRVDGSLPRVVVQGQRLEVEGGGKVAIFGGEVEVGDISGSDVFSDYPRLRASARFRQIDLGQVTRRFDFGEMHGIVEGEVENLELFRNVPLSFKARVVSVERKGVRQSIDVKAVQNLTILGTGASSNVFDKGIQRFFKRYNYAALGISAQLGNDVLLLRGLEHSGGRELFLRGRPPFSIDVVNAQPGKTVSFLAMVRRLKSLNLGQARIEP